jgi:hypothetical protein
VELKTKAQILVEFINRYSDEEAFEEFFVYNDLGLPLAVAVFNDLCQLNDKGIIALDETFTMLLHELGVLESNTEFENLDEILEESNIDEEK